MYYSKRNKPDTERQILYGLPYMWDLKNISYSQKQRGESVVARGWRWKVRPLLANVYEVSLKQDKDSTHLLHNNADRLNTTAQ